MTYRTVHFLLTLLVAALALVQLQHSPSTVQAQDSNQARGNDSEQRLRRDQDDGGAGRRRGFFRGDRDDNDARGDRDNNRSRDRENDNDDRETNRRRGDNDDQSGRCARPQDSSASTPSADSKGAASSLSMEAYVSGLIRQHDKNGDKMLQADEQEKLAGKAKAADLNKDSVIDANELVAALSGNAAATAPAASESDDAGETRETEGADDDRRSRWGRGDQGRDRERENGAGGDDKAGGAGASGPRRVYTNSASGGKSKEAANQRRTYRFTPATDRLPADLPGSFKSRDRNGDGQIAMSEFSRTWSKRTVRDFQRHDLNGDGIITPQEAVKSGWR